MRVQGQSLAWRQDLHLKPDTAHQSMASIRAGLCEEPIIEPRAVADAASCVIEPKSRHQQEIQRLRPHHRARLPWLHQTRRGVAGIRFEVGIEVCHRPRGHRSCRPIHTGQGHDLPQLEGSSGERSLVDLGTRGHGDEHKDDSGRVERWFGFDPGDDLA